MIIDTVKNMKDLSNTVIGYYLTYTDGTSLIVPIDEANRHYVEIQEWISEGNSVTD